MSPRNLILSSAVLLASAGSVLLWAALRSSDAPSVETAPPAIARQPEENPSEPIATDRSTVTASGDDRAGVAEAPPEVRIRGRAVDLAGAAIPDLAVGVLGESDTSSPNARTSADGSFALSIESLPCLVVALDPGWTTLGYGEVTASDPYLEAVVVAARSAALGGVVVDPSGRPLPGAHLELRLAPEIVGALPASSLACDWTTASGADGRFELPRVPAIADLRLRTTLSGHRADERGATPPLADLRIELAPDDPTGPVLTGTVVHADGAPAAGATVAFGSARARAGADGKFRLVSGWFCESTPLVAALPGYQPAVAPAFGASVDPNARALPDERIVIPGRELTIDGRVLGQDGEPLKGWRVTMLDATPLDPTGIARDSAEELSGRGEVRTDGDGRFRISGLGARAYTLIASGRSPASRADAALRSEPILAGTRDVVLRLPAADGTRTLRGRVRTLSGEPVAGAQLGVGRSVRPGSPGEFARQARLTAHADPDGRFELRGTPPGLLFLVAGGETLLPARLELPEDAEREELDVRLSAARTLSFDGSRGSPRPDGMRAFDGSGAAVPIWTVAAVPSPSGLARLSDGSSGALAVGEEAREVAIYRGSVELARLPLPPGRGAIGTLAWP